MTAVTVDGTIQIGPGRPLALIAGPDGWVGADDLIAIAQAIGDAAGALGVPWVLKASFDKANRTSGGSWRGVGLIHGMVIFDHIRQTRGWPILTDVHECSQVELVVPHVQMLQVPALLSRQTDLLREVGKSGLPVLLKKGQWMNAQAALYAVDKIGHDQVVICDRGQFFGHNDIVADFRQLDTLVRAGIPCAFDASHTAQFPSSEGHKSGGDARFTPALARAAVAVGAHAIFLETHPEPEKAACDGASQLALADLPGLLAALKG